MGFQVTPSANLLPQICVTIMIKMQRKEGERRAMAYSGPGSPKPTSLEGPASDSTGEREGGEHQGLTIFP